MRPAPAGPVELAVGDTLPDDPTSTVDETRVTDEGALVVVSTGTLDESAL